jgi:glyoxylase-like metal-dependent hydrolase (beta-lactamase superfamily II)
LPDWTLHTLDLQFQGDPRGVASYLLKAPGGPVLIEAGPGSTLPRLLQALAEHGIAPGDVKHVLLTHIHLDHAGAAGWWAQQGANVHVHPLGAPHLVQPERLLASAARIYGELMGPLWGEILPAPSEHVHAVADRAVVEAAGMRLLAIDTPGHARHHLVFQAGDSAFVGDVAGMMRPGSSYLRLPTPPPEFDLPAWQASLQRLRGLGLRRMYLTHFGEVLRVDEHLDRLADLLPDYAGRVRAALEAGQERDALVADMTIWEEARLEAGGVPRSEWVIFSNLAPVSMSVDGMLRYWRKQGVGE